MTVDNKLFIIQIELLWKRITGNGYSSIYPWLNDDYAIYLAGLFNREQLINFAEEVLKLQGYKIVKQIKRSNAKGR